jgi:branched-chain amino acid transport system permease protein
MNELNIFLQLTLNGIFLGGVYAAMALGFSTIWGVMRLINLVHGEFIMMGAYVAWFFFNPLREQNLTIAASTETIPNVTTIALALLVAACLSWIVNYALRQHAVAVRNPARIITAVMAFIILWQILSRFVTFEASVTTIVFTVLALIFGFYLSERWLMSIAKNPVLRRIFGLIIGISLFYMLYTRWSANEFTAIDISMMLMVFVALALSLGFIISHIVLERGLGWDDKTQRLPAGTGQLQQTLDTTKLSREWQRRIIGYGLGAILAYAGYMVWQRMGFPPIDPFMSLPILFILFFALGYVIQKGFFNRLVEGPYLTMLLVTFAFAIILQNIGLQIYAADPRRINVDYGAALRFGNITVPPVKLLMLIVSGLMVVGLVAFLRYTRTGYAIRAAAQNKTAARLMGIDIYETYAITFAVSMAITAMAGAMMGTFIPIAPINGPPWTLRAFSIVALGGLGKVEGVVAGGLLLGLAESYVGGYIGSSWQLPIAFIILVIVLIVRPQGITGGLLLTEED